MNVMVHENFMILHRHFILPRESGKVVGTLGIEVFRLLLNSDSIFGLSMLSTDENFMKKKREKMKLFKF